VRRVKGETIFSFHACGLGCHSWFGWMYENGA
jgi:hypothetical protein